MPDTTPVADVWRGRVLHFLDDHRAEIVGDLADLVRIPTVSGSDEEAAIQNQLARRLSGWGLDVDAWEIPLDETLAEPDFPGVEVDRHEGWGVVARVPGRGDGSTFML